MGKKYNVYDENDNLVARVEKVTYEKEEMPFLSMPLFEFCLIMILALFGSMYPFAVVLYIGVLITFLYLFAFYGEGFGTYINSMIIAFLHLAAFIGFIIGVAASLEQFESDMTQFFIICSFGALLAIDAFAVAVIGLMGRRRKYSFSRDYDTNRQAYENKIKYWRIKGIISILVVTVLMIASIIIYNVFI